MICIHSFTRHGSLLLGVADAKLARDFKDAGQ